MNYSDLTPEDADALVVKNRMDIGCEGLKPGEVLAALMSGAAVLERSPHGFAVVQIQTFPHLWVVYIDPASRGKGHGRQFVRDVVRKHAKTYHMSLSCHGARRRAFFGRIGFRVESREGEWRHMTTNDSPHGIPARR